MGLQLPSAVYTYVGNLHIQYAQLSYSSYKCRRQPLSELKVVCSYNPKEDPKDSDDMLIPHEKISLNLMYTNTFCSVL